MVIKGQKGILCGKSVINSAKAFRPKPFGQVQAANHMKEYQFQYTKLRDTVFVILGCIFVCIVLVGVVAVARAPQWLAFVVGPGPAIAFFFWVRRYVVRQGTAQLSDTRLDLVLGETPKNIDFQDLVSFKSYAGKNGTVLYLNTAADHFSLSANENFCDTDAFVAFCAAVIAQLDLYQQKYRPTLVHQGSIYATNGFLGFLVLATVVYLLAFAIEPPDLRPYIGIPGGLWLALMWGGCLYKRSTERPGHLGPSSKAA